MLNKELKGVRSSILPILPRLVFSQTVFFEALGWAAKERGHACDILGFLSLHWSEHRSCHVFYILSSPKI